MEELRRLSYGIAIENNNKYNVKLNNGELITNVWFDLMHLDENSERIIFAYKKTTSEISSSEYQMMNYKYGAIYEGKINVNPIYDLLIFNYNNTYTGYKEEKSGYIDSRLGLEITPMIFSYAGLFNNGEATVVYESNNMIFDIYNYKYATGNGIIYKKFNIDEFINKGKTKVLK